jgi:ABC-2 type transport system permease protein
MLMCAYMSRFIYPMLSLEGRKFWILGLLPLRRERLLWGKFAFSASGSVLVGSLLVGASDLLLGLGTAAFAIHLLTVVILAIGLSGLSVGIGALMPNFRETDPSKIAVGFGGTMNLIAGLMYLLVVLALMAGPYHLWTGLNPDGVPANRMVWVALGVVVGVGVGIAAAVVPLRAGAGVLRKMEF